MKKNRMVMSRVFNWTKLTMPTMIASPGRVMMAAAAMAHAMRNYPGLTHYEEDDLSDEEIDCDS